MTDRFDEEAGRLLQLDEGTTPRILYVCGAGAWLHESEGECAARYVLTQGRERLAAALRKADAEAERRGRLAERAEIVGTLGDMAVEYGECGVAGSTALDCAATIIAGRAEWDEGRGRET
jgi:hypothetical protein